jgi:hypothetical protein
MLKQESIDNDFFTICRSQGARLVDKLDRSPRSATKTIWKRNSSSRWNAGLACHFEEIFKADYKHELVELTLTHSAHYAYKEDFRRLRSPLLFCAIPLMRGGTYSRD